MKTVLKVENLHIENREIEILRDISLSIGKGEIIGIVGESGCGKSTLLRALFKMMNKDEKITKGDIYFNDESILNKHPKKMRELMGSKIGVVFQNPGSTLNPIRKIGTQFVETMQSHIKISKKDALESAVSMLEKVNLKDARCIINSYPFELSGGMKQRVAIALAMIMKPEILLADEPTSALDVTVGAQVVKEMMNLRDKFGTSIIMVTHSMGVVSYMADKVAVMYAGTIVEYGDKKSVLNNPMHPYTKALINAIPRLDGKLPQGIKGAPPLFTEINHGCSFAARCPKSNEACKHKNQKLLKISDDRYVACSNI